MTELATVAFDIETTGFETDDQLTVAGFNSDIGSRIFLNTDGKPCPADLQDRLEERTETLVTLSTHESERELLEAVKTFSTSKLTPRDIKIAAYNGERWRGGFDLPFLRTRLCHHGVDWPFATLPYVDAMDVFQKRFNTTEDTLTGVYEELIGSGLNELDPFTDSAEAVEAWNDGAFEPLVLHNLADIRRTRALMNLAERYCSKSDFSMKSLDPVV